MRVLGPSSRVGQILNRHYGLYLIGYVHSAIWMIMSFLHLKGRLGWTHLVAPYTAPGMAMLEFARDELLELAQTIVAGVHICETLAWQAGRTCQGGLSPLVDWLCEFLRESDEVIKRVKRGQREVYQEGRDIIPLQQSIERATEGRVFFTTKRGLTGLGPASTEPGATINVLPSRKTHFILRRQQLKNDEENDKQWDPFVCNKILSMEMIGDCYWNDEPWARAQAHETKETDGSEGESQPQGSLPYDLLSPLIEGFEIDPGRKRILLV